MKEDGIPGEDDFFPEEERKSRTRIKKEMIELQKLGEDLVDLPRSFLGKIGLPPELLEAVLYAKEVRTHGARRRQKQRIGALMREVDDPSFIRTALDNYTRGVSEQAGRPAEQPHPMDALVEDLVSGGEDRIEAMALSFPRMDADRLRRLVRHVREKPPASRLKSKQALITYLDRFMAREKKREEDPL